MRHPALAPLIAAAVLATACQEVVEEPERAPPRPVPVPVSASISYPWSDPVPGVADVDALMAEVMEAYRKAPTMGALVHSVESGGGMVWESEGTLRLRRPNHASWAVLGGQRPRVEKTDGRYVWHYSPADNEFAATEPPADPADIPARLGLPLAGALFFGVGLEAIASPWGGELVGPLISGTDETVAGVPSHRIETWLRLGIAEGMVGHLSVWVGKEDKLLRRARLVIGLADTEGWDPARLADTFVPGDIREEVYVRVETGQAYPTQTFRRTFPPDAKEVVPPAGALPAPEGGDREEGAEGAGAGGQPAPAPSTGE